MATGLEHMQERLGRLDPACDDVRLHCRDGGAF